MNNIKICRKTFHKCLLCEKKIKLLYPKDSKRKDFRPENNMWDGGTVTIINAGYGSEVDGNVYLIAICDNCLEINKNIIILGNYGY